LSEQNEKQKHYYAVGTKWNTKKYHTVGTKWKTKNVDSKQKEWKPNNLKIFGSKKTKWQAMYPFIT
jgi:hypothetical protein